MPSPLPARFRSVLARLLILLLVISSVLCVSLPSRPVSSEARLSFSRSDLTVKGLGPRGLAAEDLNGDEIPDLVVANLGTDAIPGSQTLDVFFGRGDGSFTLAQSIPADDDDMPYGMAVADLRGNGKCDVVVPNKCGQTVAVFLARADGTFDEPRTYLTGDTWSVSAADIDGDGQLDLAVGNFDSQSITTLLGNGDGTFQPAVHFPATAGLQPRAVEFGDLDGDGRPDMVVPSDTIDGRVAIFMNKSEPGRVSFAPPRIIHVGNGTGAAIVHDVNGDGKLDIIASSLASNYISVLMGNGDGSFAGPVNYSTGDIWPFGMVLTDFDGDGNPDLAVSGVSGPVVSVLLGDGRGGFSLPAFFHVEGPSRWLASGDFNLDGKMDLAVGNYTANGRFDARPDQFFKTVSVLLGGSRAPRQGPATFRVNCGGPAHTNSHGMTWSADSGFEGGKVVTTTADIAGTPDQTLFQSSRQGSFTYTAQVAPGRSYGVRLHFAEITPKLHKFDVTVNGQRRLENFNILSRVPQNTATSVTLRNVWPDQSGQIRIEFTTLKRGAVCSAISIF